MMTESSIRVFERGARLALASAVALGLTTGAAFAQPPAVDPNTGALTFTGDRLTLAAHRAPRC